MIKELTPFFDIDEKPFSSAAFIWLLLRYDLLVVKTAQEINAAQEQLEIIIENFEHKLQRSLPRPEIVSASDKITTDNATPNIKPNNDPFFTKLKQLESSTRTINCYRKNKSSTVNVFLQKLLNNNYRNENILSDNIHSVLRLNIVGQGGMKFSVIFQNENLFKIIKGWFGVNFEGTVAGMLRINTNILYEILNSDNVTSAIKNALTRCQLLLTTTPNSKLNIQNIITLFESLVAK
ncbi:MAG: hypothetical protein LBC74_03270 [Planctomycetaceae bacterium]|jgi:hypothetical protein|nr:hypothetical protein [Planctomycetaceae bacterium]